ncbi:hypothetical protein BCV69DRAFT_268300 [Microstroma glucosiphilum]|uniref:E3 ubiquitin-protein ligase n=1 Tax=Pseudomicrostroma glucosiphilum TaxID=1684307 RepID=A0A316U9E7_9BASI|nr:hypothetical protein BCV69DRAFT_268300 [Pseudomicrostroma glucosiphilum]PWN21802.1 hypothetical protein BCV69DRAFT_268300 [Pseudomicrostroma glucosiphilum]
MHYYWPSTSSSTANDFLTPPSIAEALDLLEANDWSLSRAQGAFPFLRARQARLASSSSSLKGKSPASSRAGSPSPGMDSGSHLGYLGPEYTEERRGRPCGHYFRKGEPIWRCRDCAIDDTCVQCAPCFDGSVHNAEGHDVVFSVCATEGGVCDCGDDEAWKKDVGCRYHSKSQGSTSEHQTDDEMGEAEAEASSHKIHSKLSSPRSIDRHLMNEISASLRSKDVDPAFVDALQDVANQWLEFVLATVDHAPEEQTLFLQSFSRFNQKNARDLIWNSEDLETWGSRNDSDDEEDEDVNGEEEGLMPFIKYKDVPEGSEAKTAPGEKDSAYYNRQYNQMLKRNTTDSFKRRLKEVRRLRRQGKIPADTQLPRKYALILWNDERHTFKDVIDTVKDAIGVSDEEARGVADRVDRHGRDVLIVSDSVEKLVSAARRMGGINLKVTIRPAFDVYCEEIVNKLLWVLKDLAEASIYVPRNESASKPDSTFMPSLITFGLLQEWPIDCRHEESFYTPRMDKDAFDDDNLKKLDGLLLMDFKIWKEGRSWLRQLWLSLCKISTGRRGVASHYAFSYNKIIEISIFRDREPEHSIILLTVQLFSVPSVAFELVSKFDFMRRLHDLLISLMTGGLRPMIKALEVPPSPPRRIRPVEDAQHPRLIPLLRHVLYDMKYLIQSPGVQELIVQEPRHTAYLLDWLRYFNAYASEVRETQQHIEFDGETWVLIFQVCQLLAKEARLFGQSYQKATVGQAVQALNYTLARVHYETIALAHHFNDVGTNHKCIPPIKFHEVEYGRSWSDRHQVIDFKVASQHTAFHHPMHWFLAEMSKRFSGLTTSDLTSLGISSIPELINGLDEDGLLVVFDMSIRCIVKISQVRGGLWVRNGTATRGQAAHYRDVTARGSMYDQDVFLLQAALALLPSPDRFLVTLLDRFDLVGYFSQISDATREDAQLKAAADDFLLLLITLLSEPGNACAWSMEQLIRRELIHFLALGQGTFSSTTRFIPEYMIDHPSFEKILAQVTTFRGPDGTTDQGIYELKDECYREVDPFFHHYTRNQRERAEEQLRLREKKAGRSAESLVIVPAQQLSLEPQLFARSILRAFTAPSFRYILFSGLGNPRASDVEVNETMLESILHLIVIGIVEKGRVFVRDTLALPIDDEISVLSDLCEMESRVKNLALKARIAWCLDRCEESEIANEKLDQRRAAKNDAGLGQAGGKKTAPSKNSAEARKQAAKARQAAIMQKFKLQQNTLLESLEKDEADSKTKVDADDSMEVDAKGDTTAVKGVDDDSDMEAEAEEALGSCIMCQEQLTEDSSFGRLGLVTASRTLRTTPRNNHKALKDVVDVPLNLDRVSPHLASNGRATHTASTSSGEEASFHPLNNLGTSGGGFSKEDNKTGVLASSCGHLMHVTCFQAYYRNIETRHSQQIARNHAENLSRFEFVCPLCKSLGNVILPVPKSTRKVKKESAGASSSADGSIGHQELDMTPIGDWLRKINIDILKTSGSQSVTGVQEGSNGGTGCFVSWYADSVLSWLLDRDYAAKLPEGVDGSMLVMLGRLVDVLRPMSTALRPQRVAWQAKTILAPPTSRKMYLPDELVGYTLSILEVSQRGQEARGSSGEVGNVASAISDGSLGLLRSLIYCIKSIISIDQLNTNLAPTATRNYQAALRQGLLKRLLPHWSSDEAVRSPLLLREPLSILIEAAAIVPESLSQVTTLMYYATLVQTVFGLAQPSIWPQAAGGAGGPSALRSHLTPPDVTDQEKAALQEIFPDVRWTVGHIVGFVGYARGNITLGVDGLDDLTLAKMLCTYTLPFLRRAAILRRTICGDSNSSPSGLGEESQAEPIEYLRLLADLGITPPAQGLPIRAERQAPISSIVEGWIKHAYTPLASLFRPLPINPSPLGGGANDPNSLTVGQPSAHPAHNHPTLQLEHPHIYELITLPKDLTALLQYSQRTPCKKCKTSPPEPALCLLCGEVVCYQSFCCMDATLQRGECNLHISTCGGNYGIFFKVKTNLVFLLYHSNGTFIYSPYLDSHGEVDVGLQKGRRQTLYMKRYDELRRVWLSGGVGTLVARKTEASMDPGGWDTT